MNINEFNMKYSKIFQEWVFNKESLQVRNTKVQKLLEEYKEPSVVLPDVSCPDSSGSVCKKCGNQMKLTANGGYPCGTICYSCPNCDDIDAK